MSKITSKIQLRPPHPLILLNIHCCCVSQGPILSSCIGHACTDFASRFELTFCVFQDYALSLKQLGTSSHIATLAYFCDQGNRLDPSESGRNFALLRTRLWTKSSPKSLSSLSPISSNLVPMAADILKLEKKINIKLFKEIYSVLFFGLCQSSIPQMFWRTSTADFPWGYLILHGFQSRC